MRSRDPAQPHRTATPLELFFDLCFVVAVAQASARLHHGLAASHADALLGFTMVFFAIWWAWMNFTWFASAYDPDDVPYRLLVLVQIIGVLVIAAGVPRGLEHRDFSVITAGYVIMRLALIVLWLRAAAGDPPHRRTARRYAAGIAVCQLGWIALLPVPSGLYVLLFVVMVIAELAVPVLAERGAMTRWHPHHIVERYGLLTLIVLGESVLAATVAIQSAVDAGAIGGELAAVIAGAPLVVFGMWWLYFDQPPPHLEPDTAAPFIWGYGHLLVFTSAAAAGAGIAVLVDHATGRTALAGWIAGATLTVPVALYVVMVWLIFGWRRRRRLVTLAYPTIAALVLAAGVTPWPVLVTGVLLAALVAVAR